MPTLAIHTASEEAAAVVVFSSVSHHAHQKQHAQRGGGVFDVVPTERVALRVCKCGWKCECECERDGGAEPMPVFVYDCDA